MNEDILKLFRLGDGEEVRQGAATSEAVYFVSNYGRCWSLRVSQRRPESPKCRNKGDKEYYKYIAIGDKKLSLHRMIATAFIPNPEHKPQINHKNGDKDDNRVENLEWVTQSENMKHAIATGLKEAKLYSKLSDENMVGAITDHVMNGYSQSASAAKWGVNANTIRAVIMRIRNRKRSYFGSILPPDVIEKIMYKDENGKGFNGYPWR